MLAPQTCQFGMLLPARHSPTIHVLYVNTHSIHTRRIPSVVSWLLIPRLWSVDQEKRDGLAFHFETNFGTTHSSSQTASTCKKARETQFKISWNSKNIKTDKTKIGAKRFGKQLFSAAVNGLKISQPAF